MDNKMKVIVVEPEKAPYIKEIDSGLRSLQHEVGGYIEAVYPYEDPVAIICNEEGKLNGLPLNRALRDEEGTIYDIIAGTFLITGLTEDNFGSLDNKLAEKYSDKFKTPEVFARFNGRIIAVPMAEKTDKKSFPHDIKPKQPER